MSTFLEIGKTRASVEQKGKITRLYESWKSLLRAGASLGALNFRTLAGIRPGPLDLGVELKKGYMDFAFRERNRGHCEGA